MRVEPDSLMMPTPYSSQRITTITTTMFRIFLIVACMVMQELIDDSTMPTRTSLWTTSRIVIPPRLLKPPTNEMECKSQSLHSVRGHSGVAPKPRVPKGSHHDSRCGSFDDRRCVCEGAGGG